MQACGDSQHNAIGIVDKSLRFLGRDQLCRFVTIIRCLTCLDLSIRRSLFVAGKSESMFAAAVVVVHSLSHPCAHSHIALSYS